jgi:Integral membrane protein TerC family
MFEWLTDPHVWASFIALSAMEIVLGIDNVVFISVLVARMAPEQRLMARRIGSSSAQLPKQVSRTARSLCRLCGIRCRRGRVKSSRNLAKRTVGSRCRRISFKKKAAVLR